MLTLSYSAEIFSMDKDFIGRAVVLSNTKELAILAIDEDVYNELISDLMIVFYDEVKGVMTTHCTISSYHEPVNNRDSYTFTCKVQKVLSVMQRRADVYARVDMNVEIMKVKAIKSFAGNRSIHFEEKPMLSKLKNISASGMYFRTPIELEKGAIVALELNRIIKNTNLAMAEILRKEELQVKSVGVGYGYGCHFIGMNRSVESALRQFVFNENRKQVQARKRYLP